MNAQEKQSYVNKCVNLDNAENGEDKEIWYKHVYKVYFETGFVPSDSAIVVNADNEQDALDIAVDYIVEQKWRGYYLDYEEDADYIAEYGPDGFDEITFAGNYGTPIPHWDMVKVF